MAPASSPTPRRSPRSLIGEDPSDIGKLWVKLCWAGASVGRSGLATQAIAAFDVALWDLKSKRAGLPLAKFLGSYRDSVRTYNTSGGFLHTPIEQVCENAAASLEAGIGGIKLKVGQPDWHTDVARVTKVREFLDDDVPLMVDANQQWDRATALRMGRIFEQFGLVWIEEPLDAYDAEGHANLARSLDTPIATGEMLASVAEHVRLIDAGAADIIQPDAPRIGGITQFLKLATIAESKQLEIAPHFAMEIHCHLAAAYPIEPWVEHFDWLDPLFNEHLETRDGRMWVSDRPGLGFTLSEQARPGRSAPRSSARGPDLPSCQLGNVGQLAPTPKAVSSTRTRVLTAKTPCRATGARMMCCSARSGSAASVRRPACMAARPSLAQRLASRPPSSATRTRSATAIQARISMSVTR